ncbi:MAG: hypothetical protein HYR96_04010 [Deltaproteobacteria bacterium]|nr:hypothetical protein [Deltaproteobacteria bacterium]MBI3295290.1 hypothetical protein [Deltaproteobacteria bacterium]
MKHSLLTITLTAQLAAGIASADLFCSSVGGPTLQSFTLGAGVEFDMRAQKIAAILKQDGVTSLFTGEGQFIPTRVGTHIHFLLQGEEGESATVDVSTNVFKPGHCTRAGCPKDPFGQFTGTLTLQGKDYAITCSDVG